MLSPSRMSNGRIDKSKESMLFVEETTLSSSSLFFIDNNDSIYNYMTVSIYYMTVYIQYMTVYIDSIRTVKIYVAIKHSHS